MAEYPGTSNSRPLNIIEIRLNDALFDNRIIPIDFRLEAPLHRLPNDVSTLWLISPTDVDAYFVAQIDVYCDGVIRQLGSTNLCPVRIESKPGGAFLHLIHLEKPIAIPLTQPPPESQIARLKDMVLTERKRTCTSAGHSFSVEEKLQEVTATKERFEKLCKAHEGEIIFLRGLLREHTALHAHKSNDPLLCPPNLFNEDKTMLRPMCSDEVRKRNDNKDQNDFQRSFNETSMNISNYSTLSAKEQSQKELLIGIAQQIICSLCPPENTGLPDMQHLEQHFLSQHLDDDKKRCLGCPEEPQLLNIFAHIHQHANRVYSCTKCGKRGRKHLIKQHIRTHTGEKPFPCEICGRSFGDTSTLRRHRMVHTGQKKYECPICGRFIARKDNVKQHMRSHNADEHQSGAENLLNEVDSAEASGNEAETTNGVKRHGGVEGSFV